MLQGFQVGVLIQGDSEVKVLPLHGVHGEWSSEGRECEHAGKTQIPDPACAVLSKTAVSRSISLVKADYWPEVLLRATAPSH